MKRIWHWMFDKQDGHCVHIQRQLLAQAPLIFLTFLHVGAEKLEAADIGSNSITQAAQSYRDFLANPPWLKKIQFGLDRNYRVDVTDEHHPRREEGVGIYEAAWQPNGYYKKHLDGSPLYDNPPGQTPKSRPVVAGNENISGASDRFYWRLWEGQDQVSLVPKDGQSGASNDNWLRGFFDFELEDLAKIRRLGLDYLVDANLKWDDQNHFTAQSTNHGSAHGAIANYTNGLPETIEYSFDSSPSMIFRVHYDYGSDRMFPPRQITIEDSDDSGKRITHVNYIDSLIVGLDPDAKDGYRPEMFRVRTDPFKQVSISSNGVLYHVGQRGRLDAIDTQYPGIERFNPPTQHPVIVALVMGTPSLAFFAYFMVARGRTKKQEQETST